MAMQNHHHQSKHQQQTQRVSVQSSAAVAAINFTNTAKLPIETVKLLIASVSRRPNLWIRTNNGQKRSDINVLWQEVGQEVRLPADICRIKWGHLRDNFRKVFIRNTLSAEPPTTWRFYNDMRFMEAAVAENVMRHHRLREQSLYWHGLGQRIEPPQNSLASSTVDNCDTTLQNQFNFSSFFQNHGPNIITNSSNNSNKRVKLETTESETSLQDIRQVTPPPTNSFFSNANHYEKSDNHLHMFNGTREVSNNNEDNGEDDDEDDDQFDEDAISLEENCEIPIKKDNCNIKEQNCQTTNIDTICSHMDEEDSDRLFLLSLLPYLRKVKEARKLQVRQKLQDVLIQEFG